MMLSANEREAVKIMEQFDSGSVVQRAVAAMERLDYGPEVELELVIEKGNEMTNLDRSQDEATFQQYQQEAADELDRQEAASQQQVDDEPVDYYGAQYEGHGTYEDYEPNPYDGTYSEEGTWLAWNMNVEGVNTSGRITNR